MVVTKTEIRIVYLSKKDYPFKTFINKIISKKQMKITKNSKLADVIQKHPEAIDVFQKHGLHCIGCAMSSFETIEQGAKAHNIKIDKLIQELNKRCRNQ